MLDFPTRTIQTQSAPENAGTKHLGCAGRAGGRSAATNAASSAISSAQQAAQMAQQSASALARAAQAIQAMQAVQNAARSLARSAPSGVPNGLAPGGLVPDSGLAGPGAANPVSTWVGANTPAQSASDGQTVVTINQTAPQALLNWQTFNVGAETTVNFNQQGNTTWIALNKIAATGVPSQILGSIRADGGVYLINQNGIIFGGTSQINVNTLIASSLNLTSQANFLKGSGILSDGTHPSFQSVDDSNRGYAAGAVMIQPGAQIRAPNGKVLLLGSTVANEGTISTPSGQALLLGGSDV